MDMTAQIITAVKKGYESQGSGGLDVFAIASGEVERSPEHREAGPDPGGKGFDGSVDGGGNGTGKTTTAAKLANLVAIARADGCAGGVRYVSRGGD